MHPCKMQPHIPTPYEKGKQVRRYFIISTHPVTQNASFTKKEEVAAAIFQLMHPTWMQRCRADFYGMQFAISTRASAQDATVIRF